MGASGNGNGDGSSSVADESVGETENGAGVGAGGSMMPERLARRLREAQVKKHRNTGKKKACLLPVVVLVDGGACGSCRWMVAMLMRSLAFFPGSPLPSRLPLPLPCQVLSVVEPFWTSTYKLSDRAPSSKEPFFCDRAMTVSLERWLSSW